MSYRLDRFLHLIRLIFMLSVVLWVAAFMIIILYFPNAASWFPSSVILIPLSVIIAAIVLVYVTRNIRKNGVVQCIAMLGYGPTSRVGAEASI